MIAHKRSWYSGLFKFFSSNNNKLPY